MFHIHIGAHKVGSTSLQRFFALNAGLLEELGIIYPKVGFGSFAHHPLAKAFTESKHVNARAAMKDALARLAAESPNQTFLLSSEVFEFAKSDGIGELAEAVAPHKAQILLYVRDFTKMIPSKYAQRTKTGANHKNFDDFLEVSDEKGWMNFTKTVTRWADHFGPEAMRVQVLDRETLVDGDLLRDAWAALGLPKDAFERCDPASLEPINTSPNWVAVEVVREVNRRVSHAELSLPSDQKTKGLRQTKVLDTARVAMDGLQVGRLIKVCEEATQKVGLADRPAQYLTLEQWTTLNDQFRKEIQRVNKMIPGPPVAVPPAQPPPERPFLPQISELSEEERALLGRRVLSDRAVKRLPPSVVEVVASAFGISAKRVRPPRPEAPPKNEAPPKKQKSQGKAGPGTLSNGAPRPSPQKEGAAAQAAIAARKRAAAGGPKGAAGGPKGAAGGPKGARPGQRPSLLRRLTRRIVRWSRQLRGVARKPQAPG